MAEAPAAVVARLIKDGRRIEEVTSRALGHRFRIEILAALHEGPHSAAQLARVLHQTEGRAWHHLKELLKDGAIEEAFTEERGNHKIVYYRQIELPFFSDEAIAEMTPEERQITAALIIQASAAELLAALWAGKLHSDPRVWLAWEPITLGERGRNLFADEMQRNWDAVQEIVAEDVNHRAETGEQGKKFIVATFGFERHRSEPHEPASGIIDR